MAKRAGMWSAKIEGYEAKTYWKEAFMVWQAMKKEAEEKKQDMPMSAFLTQHPEYDTKIGELLIAAEAAKVKQK